MHTHLVGAVDLDDDRLVKDLDRCRSLDWSDAYSDYVFGGLWRSCMLWARGGDVGDGEVTRYAHDRPSAFTPVAGELPYVRELVEATADLSRLNFARLAMVVDSVIIPHRDLLELGDLPVETRNAHRLHVPLATSDDCFFGEDDVVYRMLRGEVWFLDASRIHSVAVLTREPRIHLMLDFVDRPGDRPLSTVSAPAHGGGIPAGSVVPRPPLTARERADLAALARVLSTDTVDEVFAIVIKTHFRRDGGARFVWDTMAALARDSTDPDVAARIAEMHRHYTLERSAPA
jgi:hypothetical protein